MPDLSLLAVFIPTFFFVSITPGLCMTLAMTLGMSVGVRRTMWMMAGEVFGVALVALATVFGVGALMLSYPTLFTLLKYLGGAYLAYLGISMWRSTSYMNLTSSRLSQTSQVALMSQGFVTAIANPKGWAFMISLLPPFLSLTKPLAPQLAVLVAIIMCSEFICMLIYASGGKSLRAFLNRGNNLILLNRIAGTLLIAIGIWLAFG